MLFIAWILSSMFIHAESRGNVNSLEFQRDHGIIATLDGYLPRCTGCVVWGRDPLIIYGRMHIPQDTLYVLDEAVFFAMACALDLDSSYKNYDCTNYSDHNSYTVACMFNYRMFPPNSCQKWEGNPRYQDGCYCDDGEPKLWYAYIPARLFRKTTMTIRFIYDGRTFRQQRWFPYRANDTLFVKDLIDRGHITRPNHKSTNRSARRLTNLLLELSSVVLAFGTVASFMT
ncbi:uncharacterized protein LOC131928441 isoform X1 [Physella acuta]|uniref:uncharacterized protein LOC131927939 n=1 Tax=Physella acuta TaxID=109671 RepID=UPI0027DE492C|nr:uncharacterized protein LOC131927939 [Physella acuta]XP_059140465.1 uncharacterized protein LOC131928441 isoform X1 [Physella acuta]